MLSARDRQNRSAWSRVIAAQRRSAMPWTRRATPVYPSPVVAAAPCQPHGVLAPSRPGRPRTWPCDEVATANLHRYGTPFSRVITETPAGSLAPRARTVETADQDADVAAASAHARAAARSAAHLGSHPQRRSNSAAWRGYRQSSVPRAVFQRRRPRPGGLGPRPGAAPGVYSAAPPRRIAPASRRCSPIALACSHVRWPQPVREPASPCRVGCCQRAGMRGTAPY